MSSIRNVHNSAGEKLCTNCNIWRPLTEFHKHRAAWDGVSSRCKPCKSALLKADRAADPRKHKEHHYRSAYGITLAEAEAIKSFGCALCGTKTAKLHIDHDHITGAVRGCLCHMHNVGLGKFGDDPAQLRAAADYIEAGRST